MIVLFVSACQATENNARLHLLRLWGPSVEKDTCKEYFPVAPMKLTWERESIVKQGQANRRRGIVLVRALMKWGVPMFACAFCTFLGMILLHMGTYFYIHQMKMQTKLFQRSKHISPKDFNTTLSIGWDVNSEHLVDRHGVPRSLSFGSLNDPVHYWLGYKEVDISLLDAIAACFPVLFVVVAFLMDELSVWTKVMFCNAALALGKGFFGAITTVPDSKGWSECKKRLDDVGMDWMTSHPHPSFSDFFKMELFGSQGVHIRWCADMMYSGHTYFCTLYALGLYELTFYFTREWSRRWRAFALLVVMVLTIGEQVVEIYLVLLNRFHYTMDVVMAVLLTFLLFTNSAIAEISKRWVFCWVPDRGWERWNEGQLKNVKKERENLLIGSNNLPNDAVIVQMRDIRADADVFIPPCCNPCCCMYWGTGTWGGTRHHCIDDEDIGDMLFAVDENQSKVLADHMRLSLKHDILDNKNYKKARGIPDS